MNIFEILKNLTTNKSAKWIMTLDDADIVPFVIQRWLSMSSQFRREVRWLDKFVFHLSPKMYLTLAWSVIPKSDRAPFIKYIKKVDDEEEYDFITSKVRKHFELSDNDYNALREYIVAAIKKDTANWFAFYGIKKRYWDKYQINYNQIKTFVKRDIKEAPKGLAAWGL